MLIKSVECGDKKRELNETTDNDLVGTSGSEIGGEGRCDGIHSGGMVHYTVKVFLAVIFLGIVAARNRLTEICREFIFALHLFDSFEQEVEKFTLHFEIHQQNRHMVNVVLWSQLVSEVSAKILVREEPVNLVSVFFSEC